MFDNKDEVISTKKISRSFKDSFIFELSKASLKILPMICGAVLWTVVCLLIGILPCSLVTKEIMFMVVMGVFILPLALYYLWLCKEVAVIDASKHKTDKTLNVISFLLLLFFYTCIGLYCAGIYNSSYDVVGSKKPHFRDYVYVDQQGCIHSSRNCKALQSTTNNSVVAYEINDYVDNILPLSPITCALCVSDDEYTKLVTRK